MLDNIDFRYWAVFLATAVYIGMKNAKDEPIKYRLTKVFVNGLLAFGMGPDLAVYLWNSEMAAAIILMSAGWVILDVITGIVADPKLITSIVRQKLGMKGDEDQK
jgi:hypothetical protein